MAKKIRVNIFSDMREALRDAGAYERGEAINLRVTRIPARPRPISAKEGRHIRQMLNASQALFATYLNVSPNAVRILGAKHSAPAAGRSQAIDDGQEERQGFAGRLKLEPTLSPVAGGVFQA
ncbi:MAG TPA: hypothetical protein VFN26_19390 [Candidatus Acidoferrum sp.]|nr:hypothetical protein [Candidatus Acidoferrum sp.]